jgi:hypothetical protein
MKISKSLCFAACLLLLALPTRLLAGDAVVSVAEPLESVVILQVDGWIGINPEGGVAEFTTDTKMSTKLRESLDQVVHKWRFEPIVIDGTPRNVRAKTRVVLAASHVRDANPPWMGVAWAMAHDRARAQAESGLGAGIL